MKSATAIGIGVVIGIGAIAIATRDVDTRYDCDKPLHASEVSRWILGFDGKVDYRNGEWYDGDTLVGYSATEDSDVCLK